MSKSKKNRIDVETKEELFMRMAEQESRKSGRPLDDVLREADESYLRSLAEEGRDP